MGAMIGPSVRTSEDITHWARRSRRDRDVDRRSSYFGVLLPDSVKFAAAGASKKIPGESPTRTGESYWLDG
jgi:hypothetical protein